MVQTAKEGMMNNASSSEVYGKMQEVFIKMDDKMNVSSHLLISCIRILNYAYNRDQFHTA
jgi:hypothetical protein